MASFSADVIEKLNTFAGDVQFNKSYNAYMDWDGGKEAYTGIFLSNPTDEVRDAITEHGGIVASDTDEYGTLFCVPEFWVLNTVKEINTGVVDEGNAFWVRLVIPSKTPMFVITKNTKEVIIRKNSDFRIGNTYLLTSNIAFPLNQQEAC